MYDIVLLPMLVSGPLYNHIFLQTNTNLQNWNNYDAYNVAMQILGQIRLIRNIRSQAIKHLNWFMIIYIKS